MTYKLTATITPTTWYDRLYFLWATFWDPRMPDSLWFNILSQFGNKHIVVTVEDDYSAEYWNQRIKLKRKTPR